MKRIQPLHICLLLLAGLMSTGLQAQVGISSFYNLHHARVVGDASGNVSEIDYPATSELAINYWFRLPRHRIEFQPTVYYAGPLERAFVREAGFQFKTNIYLFDLGTDCDCPTFGKQGPQLDKGFFLQLSPGLAHHWNTSEALKGFDKTVFTLGAGVGIDFGLSNLVTITPLASIRHATSDYLDLTFTDENNEEVEGGTRLTTFQIGLQATFRFDKRRY